MTRPSDFDIQLALVIRYILEKSRGYVGFAISIAFETKQNG